MNKTYSEWVIFDHAEKMREGEKMTYLELLQKKNPKFDALVLASETCPSDYGMKDIPGGCWLNRTKEDKDDCDSNKMECIKCWCRKAEE